MAPLPFEKQIIILYAVLNGYFDKADLSELASLQEKLLENAEKLHYEKILEPLKKTGVLTEEIENELKTVLAKI